MGRGQALRGLLVGVSLAIVGLPALAAGPTIPENPTLADKKAFLAAVLRYIEEHKFEPSMTEHKNPRACNEVVDAVKRGDVTFLEPEAFDPAKKPQEVVDIEKRCPKLDLGGAFLEDGVTHFSPRRNFKLYRLPLGPPAPTPVFYAEQICSDKPGDGFCDDSAAVYELIDPDGCARESARSLIQKPNHLGAFVRIGSDYFDLDLDDSGTYGSILIIHIPSRRPFPKFHEWFRCSISPEKAR